jgi:hypothetical protein
MKKLRNVLSMTLIFLFLVATISSCTNPTAQSQETQSETSLSETTNKPISSSSISPSSTSTPTPVPTASPTPAADLHVSGAANRMNYPIIENGEYLYWIGAAANEKTNVLSTYLLRANRDGSNLTALGDSEKYTLQILKIEEKITSASPVTILYVKADRLYLNFEIKKTDTTYESSIYSMNLDGDDLVYVGKYDPESKESIKLVTPTDGEWYYYCSEYNNSLYDGEIYRERSDGSDREVLYSGFAHDLQIRDGWLYFITYIKDTNQVAISRMNIDTLTREDIYVTDSTQYKLSGLNVAGKWLFFSDFDEAGHLYRIGTDGEDLALVSKAAVFSCVIFDNTIIYAETADDANGSMSQTPSDTYYYRMDLDGSNTKCIFDPSAFSPK